MLSRRLFLEGLAAAFAVDPERLLWLPGKKVISIPQPRVRQRHHFGKDLEITNFKLCSEYWPPNPYRDHIEEVRDRLEAEIRSFCEQQTVRPRFLPLALPLDGAYAERCTFHRTGFISRLMICPDIRTGKLIARVDALFEA